MNVGKYTIHGSYGHPFEDISFLPQTYLVLTLLAKVNGGPGPTATLKQRRGVMERDGGVASSGGKGIIVSVGPLLGCA